MNSIVKKGIMGLTAVAAVAAMSTPADAQRYRGGYGGHYYGHHHGDTAGAAVLGGIVGLGVGAAIASSSNRGYYGNGYYSGGYGGGYYNGGPGYYDNGYYAPPPPRCWTRWSWDPYYGRQVPVQVCR